MGLIQDLFGKSPFGPLFEHTKKVHECVKLVRPLLEAQVKEDFEEVHRLQDRVSKLEYEADLIKHEIREQLPRKYLLPVQREDLDAFLRFQDRIADFAEDFAVILLIRETKIHPDLHDDFFEFVDQVLVVCNTLLEAAQEMLNLVETGFGGGQGKVVLARIEGLGQEEWKADRMQRSISRKMYKLEKDLDPITILFYEKMLKTLSEIANEAENTGDLLRTMIVKG
ncbi:MAG: TIGR00153 family protein [Planctomycetota bacterium]|jgi:predicted phosphate transport protein (TIGR00153 family)